jgi:uncharacterized protein
MKHYPEAYLRYLEDFHITRDYFECHETLEEYWKENPDSPYRITWVGLIQVAVALYHERRGNRPGALKMLSSAVKRLEPEALHELGVDAERFSAMLHHRLAHLRSDSTAPYEDLNIPVQDAALLPYIRNEAQAHPDPYLINKHTMRDRSDVIAARAMELKRRRGSKL